MSKEIRFSDYIMLETSTYDLIIYNPVYSEELGLYLYNDDEKPIRNISIDNSRVTLHYLDGEIKTLKHYIMSVSVEDTLFRRRTNKSISGNLFYYDKDEAIFYDLDVTTAVTREIVRSHIKKKVLVK